MSKPRILPIALLLSLSLNLVFIGAVGTRFMWSSKMPARPLPPSIDWMVRGLAPQRMTEMAEILESHSSEVMPVRRGFLMAQRRVNELMSTTPLDDSALNNAFEQLRAANLNYQKLSHQHTLIILAELSDEERTQALQFINNRSNRSRPMGDRSNLSRRGGPRFGLSPGQTPMPMPRPSPLLTPLPGDN